MNRPLILVALMLPAAAAAAPVPKMADEQKFARAFGAPADPPKGCKLQLDRDTLCVTVKGCKLRLDRDALRVTVPAGIHSFQHPGGASGVRTARQVTGDFTAEVAVRVVVPDGAAGLLPREEAGVSAGLIVRHDANRFLLHQFGWRAGPRAVPPGGQGPFKQWFLTTRAGYPGFGGPHTGPAGEAPDARVRLVRRGVTLTPLGNWAAGKRDLWWKHQDGIDMPGLPDAVEVGVVVEHWLDKPVEVVFREFTVIPDGAPKR